VLNGVQSDVSQAKSLLAASLSLSRNATLMQKLVQPLQILKFLLHALGLPVAVVLSSHHPTLDDKASVLRDRQQVQVKNRPATVKLVAGPSRLRGSAGKHYWPEMYLTYKKSTTSLG
jgi:hypothetical protein